jgi:hypothetical protein
VFVNVCGERVCGERSHLDLAKVESAMSPEESMVHDPLEMVGLAISVISFIFGLWTSKKHHPVAASLAFAIAFLLAVAICWPLVKRTSHEAPSIGSDSYLADDSKTKRLTNKLVPTSNVAGRWVSVLNDPQWVPPKKSSDTNSECHLNMWGANATVTDTAIIIHLKVGTWKGWDASALEPADGAYITETDGHRDEMIEDHQPSLFSFLDSGHIYELKADEVYPFDVTFQPLRSQCEYVILHHPQFESIKLTLDWDGKRLTAQQVTLDDRMRQQEKNVLDGKAFRKIYSGEQDKKSPPDSSGLADNNNGHANDLPETISTLQAEVTDPHICEKPDGAYFANWGPEIPRPAGSGGYSNPEYLFDARHQDNKINWANGFKGKVPVCFIVNEHGDPIDIRFAQSPGEEIERHLIQRVTGWRYKPAMLKQNWLDDNPQPVRVQMAFDFIFQ